ncbi:MAG: HD domain-containing protein [Candidatus Lokiarchaeota archaeon]|nr:HD domain-containing protein [Candidatus Lokiarchaeota archaeon]
MFSRQLTEMEKRSLLRLEDFVRSAHASNDSHDYSHILSVAHNAITIAKSIEDPVDPFILISGALLHDIGKSVDNFNNIHGLFGGSIAEEFLDGQNFPTEIVNAVTRVVIRHTHTSFIPPETTEEKICADSDMLDRFGVMGLVRGLVGRIHKSMDQIIDTYMNRWKNDLKFFHFDISKKIAEKKQEEIAPFLSIIRDRLDERMDSINNLFIKEKMI